MTLVRNWVQDIGTDTNDGLTGSPRDAIFTTQRQVTVPAAARLLRLVASCGLSALDHIIWPVGAYGYPMVYQSLISMQEGPSVRYPAGRIATLNAQAGEFVAQVAVMPPYDTVLDGTTFFPNHINNQTITTWSGHMDHVDQSLSQGSIHTDIGTRIVQLEFDTVGHSSFVGIPPQPSPSARISWVLRVLYEADDGR